MLFLLGPVALLMAAAGGMLLAAARQVEVERSGSFVTAGRLPGGRLALRMQDGLERTALAVDVLVDLSPENEVLRTREPDPDLRRATNVVMGAGLIGLAAVMMLGLVLLLVG